MSTNSVFTLGAFVRRDDYNYYPSSDRFADLGPPSLQRQSVGQNRTLTNAGLRSDLSYVKGMNKSRLESPTNKHFSMKTTRSVSSILPQRALLDFVNRGKP